MTNGRMLTRSDNALSPLDTDNLSGSLEGPDALRYGVRDSLPSSVPAGGNRFPI